MAEDRTVDYYEVLQVNPTAEIDTVHRVYRLLAQRFHPDNKETGDERRFREISEAYGILSNPEKRARYDVTYQQQRQARWRLVSAGAKAENDFEMEHIARLTVLEALYTKRRLEPGDAGIFSRDLEELTGRPREHLEFTIWYLLQKKLINRGDNMNISITAEGVEYIEKNFQATLQTRRLQAAPK